MNIIAIEHMSKTQYNSVVYLNLQKVYVPFAISITPDEVPRSLVELVVMLTIVQVTVALPYAPLLVRSIASVLPKPESGSCVVTLD